MSSEELAGAARDVDAVVCLLTDRIDAEVLRSGATGRLRVVGNVAVGYDNVDVVTAAELGIVVCNTPGVLDQTTADLAFFLILAALPPDLRRRERPAGRAVGRVGASPTISDGTSTARWSGWSATAASAGRSPAGRAGSAWRCSTTPGDPPAFRATWPTSDELLGESDAVSLHVPLTPDTHHLVDRRALSLMKPTAVLVNTSRGPVVDEEALASALEAGSLFGAGIDVYEKEPEIHPKLLAAPHTVLLPHVGSATTQTRARMGRLASQGVCDVLSGRTPPNVVTPR